MQRTWYRTGMIAAAVAGLLPLSALADGPSEKCRDAATQCREAFSKLETCLKSTKKAPAPEPEKAPDEAPPPPPPENQASGEADACATERAATDSACKTSNSACVKDGSRHAPHARKG